MSPEPPVVLVLDPRPGERPADQLLLPDGRPLVTLVGERAVAEGGDLAGVVSGAAGLAELIGRIERATCLVDGAALALPTTYGDVVADPRLEESSVLSSDGGRAVAVRIDAEAAGNPGTTALLVRALGGAPPGSALTVLAGALAAAGGPVRQMAPGDFPLTCVGDPPTLAAALSAGGAVDEAALRLRRSSRADDGFLSTFLVRPLSRQLTKRAVALGLRPSAITGVSCLLGLSAAAAYAGGSWWWRLAGSVLLLVSLVVDCVDGEVARYTRTFSPLGGWLDVGSDRVKEYAVYAGLAWGAHPRAWGLATAAFAVLVVRHFVDFGYAARVSDRPGRAGPHGQGRPDPVADWSARTSARPALMWAKRAVVMPVGERTIALAVLVPVVGARWALGLLLAAGCVSASYTLLGRLGRVVLARGDADRPTLAGRVGWLAPAGARAVEQGGLALLIGWHRPGALAAAYLLLAAVAMHQYDVVYRLRLAHVRSAGGWYDRLDRPDRLGWPARVLLVVILTLVLPSSALRVVLGVAGGLLALAAGVDSATWWRRFVRSGRQARPEPPERLAVDRSEQ